jgi:hypothetical protein
MTLMSPICSLTCSMPTLWPVKTVLRLIFCRLKQMRPHVVTGADGLGQAVLLENGLKHWKRIGFLGGGERLAGERVAAGKVVMVSG